MLLTCETLNTISLKQGQKIYVFCTGGWEQSYCIAVHVTMSAEKGDHECREG